MAEYRLERALPQSRPGSQELHYGRMCKVKEDGVWAELTELEARNFLAGKLIHGPIISDEPVKEPEPVKEVEHEKPVGKKRGPKPKAEKEDDIDDILKGI